MQKRYWLRGGIVGLVLALVIYVSIALVPMLGYFIEWALVGDISYRSIPYTFFSIYSLIGLVVGFIYGKIKNRNKVIQ